MKRIFLFISAASLLLAVGCSTGKKDFRQVLDDRLPVMDQQAVLEIEEAMTLQDYYKRGYQAFFGAEHLAPDTVLVIRYLNYELQSMAATPPLHPLVEPLSDASSEHAYYRLSIRLVADGAISAQDLAYAFIASAEPVVRGEEEWQAQWLRIEAEALAKHPELADEELQTELLQLAEHNVQVHHSEKYRMALNPHYRIIRDDVLWALLEDGKIRF